jgi:hypothetical protein
MTPCTVSIGIIPKSLMDTFQVMRTAFENLPDFEGEVITCHAICTAFAERFNLTCVDGWFGTGNGHSWIIDSEHPEVVIDMYPAGGAGSFIVRKVYRHFALPWNTLYIPKAIDVDEMERKRQVGKILAVI